VLINLLRNSTKFTFTGYIVIRVTKSKLSISKDSRLLALADAVQFEVYDTGIGINREN